MFYRVNDKLAMGAETYRTSRSWGHKAHLYRVRTPEFDDEHIQSVKITYYNRTWERYEFETILEKLADTALKNKVISKEEHETLREFIKNYQEPNRLAHVAMVAKLGDLFTDTVKESNDWKERMLKAGLPEGALQMPEDWNELSETEKENRLNGAIQALQ